MWWFKVRNENEQMEGFAFQTKEEAIIARNAYMANESALGHAWNVTTIYYEA